MCVLLARECSALLFLLLTPRQSNTERSLMIHIPGNSRFLFHLLLQPEYPWRPPCAMARSQNAQAVAGVKPVPKDLGKARTLSEASAPVLHPETLGGWLNTWGRDGGTDCQAVAISLQPPPLVSQGDDLAVGLVPAASPPTIPAASEDRHKPEPQ